MAYTDFYSTGTCGPVPSAAAYCKEIAQYLRAHPESWTQQYNARDDGGNAVEARDPSATRWCALGLVERFIDHPVVRQQACELLSRAVTPYGDARALSPAAFNDSSHRTVADIIQMFEAAALLPDVSEFRRPRTSSNADQTMVYGFGESEFAKMFKQEIEVQNQIMTAAQAKPPEKILLPPPDWTQLVIEKSAERQQKLLNSLVPWSKIMQQIRDSIAA